MPAANAVVLVIDRLGTLCLGPYGNTWMDTPGWNRLAADSLLCEQMLVDSPDLERVYRSYWQGLHAMCPADERDSLPSRLRAAGVRTVLLTDESVLERSDAAADFDERVRLEVPRAERAADDVEQTELARSMAETLGVLAGLPEPFLLWVHLRGLGGSWDAPAALRNQFADEDDPLPGDFVQPPRERLTPPVDPDHLLQLTHAYAGQVTVLDACLAALDDALRESRWASPSLLAVTSCRGYPLGEHGRVGACDEALYHELLHVPCVLRHPQSRAAGFRLLESVQPADLHATLLDWHGLAAAGDSSTEGPGDEQPATWGRSLWQLAAAGFPEPRPACSITVGERSIRTPGWFLRDSEEEGPRLFAKPDDLWEVNEVADRRPDVIPLLLEQLDAFQDAARRNDPASLRPLAAELLQAR